MVTPRSPLRIGFVPEHFSTPLHFAQKHFSLLAKLIPFPSGTGHMIIALRAGEIDVGIGLTEGWVAGLGKANVEGDGGYRIVGTYVETPLCWAISTGSKRNINGIADLRNTKMGVSRIGSGSFVMGFVLADGQGWVPEPSSEPFEVVPLQTFENLRRGVNDGTVDFFMWEHFTSKKYYDNGEIKRIGEIYTPWSSWKIVAATSLLSVPDGAGSVTVYDARLDDLFEKLNKGIKYFLEHQDEAVDYIISELDYEERDAREWLKTVEFASEARGVDINVVRKTMEALKKARVLVEDGMRAEEMVGRHIVEQRPGPT